MRSVTWQQSFCTSALKPLKRPLKRCPGPSVAEGQGRAGAGRALNRNSHVHQSILLAVQLEPWRGLALVQSSSAIAVTEARSSLRPGRHGPSVSPGRRRIVALAQLGTKLEQNWNKGVQHLLTLRKSVLDVPRSSLILSSARVWRHAFLKGGTGGRHTGEKLH